MRRRAETEQSSAVLLDPLRPLLISADGGGVLRVTDLRSGACANRFHAASGAPVAGGGARAAAAAGQPPVAVRSLFQVRVCVGGGKRGGGGGALDECRCCQLSWLPALSAHTHARTAAHLLSAIPLLASHPPLHP
jgi:hypothetical protein